MPSGEESIDVPSPPRSAETLKKAFKDFASVMREQIKRIEELEAAGKTVVNVDKVEAKFSKIQDELDAMRRMTMPQMSPRKARAKDDRSDEEDSSVGSVF